MDLQRYNPVRADVQSLHPTAFENPKNEERKKKCNKNGERVELCGRKNHEPSVWYL